MRRRLGRRGVVRPLRAASAAPASDVPPSSLRLAAFAWLTFIGASALAGAPSPVIEGNTIKGVRNARYCEIIPIVREGLHLKATVYNTLGLNDCPASAWNAITEDAMRKRFGAVTVLMNGPRFFLMDQITTKSGETIEVDGLQLTGRATIDIGLL